jgi:hypothetical protein
VGEWESHTSGIGSKLLAKMGYRPGKGLGREGEGIVKPLGIGLKAPSRKKELLGLGHDERNNAKEGKENEKEMEGNGAQAFDEAGNPIPRKRRRGKKRTKARDEDEDKKSDMFGFLNDLGQAKRDDKTKTATRDGSGGKEKGDVYKKMTTKELQDAFKKKIVEKDEVSAKVQQLQDSVQRNKEKCVGPPRARVAPPRVCCARAHANERACRDPAVAAQAKLRMKEARARLHALHSEIKELTTRLKIKEGVKKSIVF